MVDLWILEIYSESYIDDRAQAIRIWHDQNYVTKTGDFSKMYL
jgi:hypothetical protein